MSDFILLHKINYTNDSETEVIIRKDNIDIIFEKTAIGSHIELKNGQVLIVSEKPSTIYAKMNIERIFVDKDGKIERMK